MLHPLHITLHFFFRYPKETQELGQDSMAITDRLGNGTPLFCQDQPPVALVFDKTLGIQTLDHVGHTRLGDPKTQRDINSTGIPLRIDQLLDPFKIILDGRR